MASLRKLFLALGPFLVGIQRVHFTYYLLFLINCRNISSRCYTTQLYRAKQKVKRVTGTQISSERSKSTSREAQDPRICGVNLTILWPFTRDCGTLFLCLQGLQNVVYMLLHLQLALLASFPVSLWKKICSNTRAASWQHWGLRGWAEFFTQLILTQLAGEGREDVIRVLWDRGRRKPQRNLKNKNWGDLRSTAGDEVTMKGLN